MKDNIITIYDEKKNSIDYKILLIIEKKYKYVIYTDLDNFDLKRNLYAIKVNSLTDINETLKISNEEWKMIENEYQKLLKGIENEKE